MEEVAILVAREGDLRLSSCIFYNFYDQIQTGIDAKVLVEKCSLSEPRNRGIYSVNPASLVFRDCNVTKPRLDGAKIEFGSRSS